MEKLISKYWFLIILLLSLPAVHALFVGGYFGASDDMHIAWLYELDRTIKLGQFPPRFVPDLSFGFGYPLFNFVFPLPFYTGELFHLLGLTLVDSVKMVLLISIPLSGLFMFLLLREFTKMRLALIGSLLYMYAPYRAVDIYIRGAIGEAFSFVFLPLIILSVLKLNDAKKLKWIGIGALSLSSLLLSHNITAYMFSPFVLIFFILQVFRSAQKKLFILRAFIMFFLGFLVSIYFWLPALLESSLFKYDAVFNFFDHFPTLKQLITPYWGYGGSVPGDGDGMSFFLGSANLLVLLLSVLTVVFKRKTIAANHKVLLVWVFGGLTIALFLMNYRSSFVWDSLPFITYFQFPWRFLILVTFFVPLLVVTLEKLRFQKILITVILILIVFPNMSFFRPQDFLGRDDNYYLNRYIPVPSASEEYLKLQEEYLRLPKVTVQRPDKNYPLLFPDTGIKKADKRSDLNVAFEFESDKAETVNLNKYYFPGWKAKIDGVKAELSAGKPYGQISLFIPAGYHRAEIYFEETPFRQLLNFASLGAFLVSLIIIFL